MKIAGFIKNSFVDYPGKMSAVVFTPGCNMNCWYCHNMHIVKDVKELYDENEILDFLKNRIGFLDAVTISGGEATLQPDLKEFIKKLKEMNFLVKLDTNGLKPEVVQDLINEKLIDYIAMDIKAPLDKYESVVRVKTNAELVKKSINIIINSGVDYEFRTTFCPGLKTSDVKSICKSIEGAKRFYLQAYRTSPTMDLDVIKLPYKPSVLKNALAEARKHIKMSELRGL